MLKAILRFGAEKTAKGRTKGVVIYIFSYNLECGWEVPHKNYINEKKSSRLFTPTPRNKKKQKENLK